MFDREEGLQVVGNIPKHQDAGWAPCGGFPLPLLMPRKDIDVSLNDGLHPNLSLIILTHPGHLLLKKDTCWPTPGGSQVWVLRGTGGGQDILTPKPCQV